MFHPAKGSPVGSYNDPEQQKCSRKWSMLTCTPRCGVAEAADEIGKKTEYLKRKITELETNRTRTP
jgi:hypothetical protein